MEVSVVTISEFVFLLFLIYPTRRYLKINYFEEKNLPVFILNSFMDYLLPIFSWTKRFFIIIPSLLYLTSHHLCLFVFTVSLHFSGLNELDSFCSYCSGILQSLIPLTSLSVFEQLSWGWRLSESSGSSFAVFFPANKIVFHNTNSCCYLLDVVRFL